MKTATKTIGLWIDNTDGAPVWVVSCDTDTTSDTLTTFPESDYANALKLAKAECQRTGYPVVKTNQFGNKEEIYSVE